MTVVRMAFIRRRGRLFATTCATLTLGACAVPGQTLGFGYARTDFSSSPVEADEGGGWLEYRVPARTTGPVTWVPLLHAGFTAVRGVSGTDDVALFNGDLGLDVEYVHRSGIAAYAGARAGLLRGAEWIEDDVVVNYARGLGGTIVVGAYIPVIRRRAGLDLSVQRLGGRFTRLEYLADDAATGGLRKITDEDVRRSYSAWRLQLGWRGPFSALNPLLVLGL